MPKRSSNGEPDINQLAAAIVAHTTSGNSTIKKNPAAVALGHLGGIKGGKARAQVLSKERRIEIARKAAISRWNKKT